MKHIASIILLLVMLACMPLFARDNTERSIVFNYSFVVSDDSFDTSKDILQTIFEFEHLKKYSRGVYRMEQSHATPQSHVVLYEYRHAMFKTVIMFKRTLDAANSEVRVKMMSCWDNVPFLPVLKAMTGRYKVTVNAKGQTVVQYRTVSHFDESPGSAYRKVLKSRSEKFMRGLQDYLQPHP